MCNDTRENPGWLKIFHNEHNAFANLYRRDVDLNGDFLAILLDFVNLGRAKVLPRVQ